MADHGDTGLMRNEFKAFARREYLAGRLDRRVFLRAAAGAVALPLVAPAPALGAGENLVLANWGGDLADAEKKHFIEPFEKDEGATIGMDTSGPLPGRIRAMVEAGQVIWDVCDTQNYTSMQLGRIGLLQPIDYDIVDASLVGPQGALQYGVTYGWWSVVLAYNRERFAEKQPNSWADFFNTSEFPGKRGLWKYGYAWEAAALAAGSSMAEIYPLDTESAIKTFQSIRDDSIYYGSISEGQAMLRDGEVDMAALFSTRAALLNDETDGRVTWTWNQGLMGSATWIVPKGSPGEMELTMRFINSTLLPERQKAFCEAVRMGPANPDVFAQLSDTGRMSDPRNPGWLGQQLVISDSYYAEHEEELVNLFLDRVAGG